MAVKLLRTIRLDGSDKFVFERTAEPGEWAVPGGFMFWDSDPAKLEGKPRQAFRSGFLGLASRGWSTLTVVSEASEAERQAAFDQLTDFIAAEHGAPDRAAASAAAGEELDFAASLADHPIGTLVALQRTVDADGEVRERFRTLHENPDPKSNLDHRFARPIAWSADQQPEEEATPAEEVSLADLAAGKAAGRSVR